MVCFGLLTLSQDGRSLYHSVQFASRNYCVNFV
jgi:hypothetical protein